MRIVHVILTTRFAGSERYMIELANAQSLEHEVIVVLHRDAAQQRPDALAHRLLPGVKTKFVQGWRFMALWDLRRLLSRIDREWKPDVVHAHLSVACRALQTLQLRALRVATLHIRYKPQQHDKLDALIAIATWQLEEVPAAQRARTRQIDNWTQLTKFDPDARLRMRRELGIADDEFFIGAMGRADASKGMDVLLKAFDRMRRDAGASSSASRSRLALVGAGREWASLRKLAPPDVLMPGFVSHPLDWYAAFDAFVSPSRSEPFGLVLLEAMASGLPIIATASEGATHLSRLIERPLVPCGDVVALSQALAAVVTERPKRRQYDLSHHSPDTKVEAINAWYRERLSAKMR